MCQNYGQDNGKDNGNDWDNGNKMENAIVLVPLAQDSCERSQR